MGGDFGQMSRSAQTRRRWRSGGRLAVAGLAVAGHAAVLAALIGMAPSPQAVFEPSTISVELAPPPAPRPTAEPLAVSSPAPSLSVPAPPSQRLLRRAAAPAEVQSLPASEGLTDDPSAVLSAAQLAWAATAGSGAAGGRPCDIARQLQAALRRDPRVQAAVAEAARAPGAPRQVLFIWNGDWIRSQGQDGAGLAAVREVILWEVGFAPVACRAEPVHGLVLFSMGDAPGAPRLVLGADEWRWSDLLHPRSGRP